MFFTVAVTQAISRPDDAELLTVYEFGVALRRHPASLQYRFTDSLSVTVGMLYFLENTATDMAVQEISPVVNRAGRNAYRRASTTAFAGIRKRDEVFMKLRWTF